MTWNESFGSQIKFLLQQYMIYLVSYERGNVKQGSVLRVYQYHMVINPRYDCFDFSTNINDKLYIFVKNT